MKNHFREHIKACRKATRKAFKVLEREAFDVISDEMVLCRHKTHAAYRKAVNTSCDDIKAYIAALEAELAAADAAFQSAGCPNQSTTCIYLAAYIAALNAEISAAKSACNAMGCTGC